MATVTFWSPLQGGSGSTAHTASVASMIGMEYQTKVLIGHGGAAGERMERAFQSGIIASGLASIVRRDCGMDALERLCLNRRLNKENIVDYTIPIIMDRLDLVAGNVKREGTLPGYRSLLLPSVLSYANEYYDLVLMDAGSGGEEVDLRGDGVLLSSADLIVVSLTQDLPTLENFFSGSQLPAALQHKPYIIVLGRYDPNSYCTIQSIKSKFGFDGSIHGVPYVTSFMDAWNMEAVLPFMDKSRLLSSNHPESLFYEAIRSLSNDIICQLNLSISAEIIERGA